MKKIVDADALQAVLNYLSKQPYDEVFNLINGVMSTLESYDIQVLNPGIINEEKNQAGKE